MPTKRRNPRSWGSVRRLPSGNYQARTAPDARTGERITIGTYDRKADADAALARAREEQRTGGFVAPAAGRLTFGELASQWMATRITRPSTTARDESYLRSKILPHLGHLDVGRIDAAVLRSWVADLTKQGLAPATVQKAHQIVSGVLAQACADRRIATNPALMVNNLPRIPASRRRALDDSEVAALAGAMDARYAPMVLLGAFAGLRPGELIGLRVSDIDTLRRQVTIARTATDVRGTVIIGPPKTDAGVRTVPVPHAVMEALNGHIAQLGLGPGDLLFPAPEGGPLRLNGWRARYWNPAITAARISPPITPHQLRHTAISRWVREGVDLVTVAKRGGHESVKTLAGHLRPRRRGRGTCRHCHQ